MTITQTFTPPTTAPSRTQTKTEFDTNIENRLDWDATHVSELTTWTTQANALVVAGTLSETQDTSASSVSIGIGTKSFTVTAGKSFVVGMTVSVADTASPSANYMIGIITSYSSTTLQITSQVAVGSGTITAWTIAQSSPYMYIETRYTLGTPTAATSGTSIDFTGIPSGTKQIQITYKNVSTNGSSNWLVQIGDSGGVETTGYLGTGGMIDGTLPNATAYTTGYGIRINDAWQDYSGTMTLSLENSSNNTWTCSGLIGNSSGGNQIYMTAGMKSLSATLDRVRLTTVNGTDAFDGSGEVNILYI